MTAKVEIPLKSGENRITFSALKGWGLDTLRVEVLDAGGVEIR